MYSGAWGGSEDLWYGCAMQLLADGYQVTANVCEWHEPVQKLDDLVKAEGELSLRPQDHDPSLGILQRIARRLRPYRPSSWLQSARPDLVVMSLSGHHQGAEWMAACKAAGLRYIIVVQAVGDGIWLDAATAVIMRQNYEGAHHCYFVSNGNLDQVRNQIASPLNNASVARNPFNVSFDAHPEWPGEEKTIIACVGRLHSVSKGQDILFSVLSQKKWKERPIEIRMYGGGPDESTLRELQRMYDLQNVTFAGFQKDVEQIWRECHALVLPSRYEGLPLAIVEAMLCGRPCIVTDVAGNSELMEDDISGFVAAAPRVKYLDEAMERAWRRRSEWKSIGELAAERVRQFIPPNPISVFSQSIIETAEKKQA